MDRIERHYYLNQLIEKRDNGRVNDHWNRPHDLYGTKSLLFGIGAYPMRKSRNGYGVVSNYYQPGKTY